MKVLQTISDVLFGDGYGNYPQSYGPPLVTDAMSTALPSVSSPLLPARLCDARILVAGGGPCGILTAIMLSRLGCRHVTVLERDPAAMSTDKEADYDIGRAYVFAVNPRGQAALSTIDPGLLPFVRGYSAVPDGYRMIIIRGEDGTVVEMDPRVMFNNFRPGMLFFRPELVRALSAYVVKQGIDSSIDIRTGPEATIDRDGPLPPASEYDVILACDGAGSAIVSALQRDEQKPLHGKQPEFESRYGFGQTKMQSRVVGNHCKSIVLQKTLFDGMSASRDKWLRSQADKIPKNWSLSHWTRIGGSDFCMYLLPIPQAVTDRHGGYLGTISTSSTHPLWDMKSTDEAFECFRENFAYLDGDTDGENGKEDGHIRGGVISEAEMKRFLNGNRTTFRPITQLHSLSARSQTRGQTVIVLGDAAHCVPPDMGQGLNAALEDVAVLYSVLREVAEENEKANWAHVSKAYEEKRLEDAKSVCELCQFGGQSIDPGRKWSKVRDRLVFADRKIRELGHKYLPEGFIYPPPFAMVSRQWPYSIVRRRHRLTTIRLAIATVVATIAVVNVISSVRNYL